MENPCFSRKKTGFTRFRGRIQPAWGGQEGLSEGRETVWLSQDASKSYDLRRWFPTVPKWSLR